MNTSTEKTSDAVKQMKTDLNDSQRLLGHNEACVSTKLCGISLRTRKRVADDKNVDFGNISIELKKFLI